MLDILGRSRHPAEGVMPLFRKLLKDPRHMQRVTMTGMLRTYANPCTSAG